MDTISNALKSIIQAVDLCLENKLILPALILIYSGIDIVGSLEREEGETSKASFIKWANTYLLKEKSLGCSDQDLYAARCGILHTASAESNLSKSGKALKVYYAWGTAESNDLRKTGKLIDREDNVVIHVSDLFTGFKLGITHHMKDISEDPVRMSNVIERAGKVFSQMPTSLVSDILDSTEV